MRGVLLSLTVLTCCDAPPVTPHGMSSEADAPDAVGLGVDASPGCGEGGPCDPGLVCVDAACVCDTTAVSFAADVRPRFATGCGPGCHVYVDATSGSADLNLHASHAFAELVGVKAFQCAGDESRTRVVPGDVAASYLMDKLLGRDLCGGVRMPKGRSAWSVDELAALGRWICQGARDD